MISGGDITEYGEPIWRGRLFDPRQWMGGLILFAMIAPFILVFAGMMDSNLMPEPAGASTNRNGKPTDPRELAPAIVGLGIILLCILVFPAIRILRTRFILTPRFLQVWEGRDVAVWPLDHFHRASLRPVALGASQLDFIIDDVEGSPVETISTTGHFDPAALKDALSRVGMPLEVLMENFDDLKLQLGERISWQGRRRSGLNDKLVYAMLLIGAAVIGLVIYWLYRIATLPMPGYYDDAGIYYAPSDTLQLGLKSFMSIPFILIFAPGLIMGSLALGRGVKGALHKRLGKIIITDRRLICTTMGRRRVTRQFWLRDIVDVGHSLWESGSGFLSITLTREAFDAIWNREIPYDEGSGELAQFYFDNVEDSEAAYAALIKGARLTGG